MNSSRLLACPSCKRHVRASEDTCPFCAAAVPQELRAVPAPRPPTVRLSRAALYVFGATSIGVAVACSGSVSGVGLDDGGADASQGPAPTPAYGSPGPPLEASPGDAAPDHVIAPMYGLPADAQPFDAPDDAISTDGGGPEPDAIGPVYGAPPDAEPFDAEPFDGGGFGMDGGGISAYGLPPMH
jgi:hypothetical protein